MKRAARKLSLRANTIRVLRSSELRVAAGGRVTWTMFTQDLKTCVSCDCEGTD